MCNAFKQINSMGVKQARWLKWLKWGEVGSDGIRVGQVGSGEAVKVFKEGPG